jgi:hypothetical protein
VETGPVLWHGKQRMFEHIRDKEIPDYEDDLFPKFLNPGWKLANQLLSKKWFNMTVVLEVVCSTSQFGYRH